MISKVAKYQTVDSQNGLIKLSTLYRTHFQDFTILLPRNVTTWLALKTGHASQVPNRRGYPTPS